jgi:tetratricopeptide (TPR) repeat protein
MLLTRLELYLRSTNLRLLEVVQLSGVTRQHFLRLRMGEGNPTVGTILAVTGAARKLSGERVKPGVLFERVDSLLRTTALRLSLVHREDRKALDALLAQAITARFSEFVSSTGVASETALRHLLDAAKARLNTNPAAAAAIYEGAVDMGTALRSSPRQLAASLVAHALKGRANALRRLGSFDDALTCLTMAGELFVDAAYCTAEAGQVAYTRATVLFELELWDDALDATRFARKRFVQSGDVRRTANADLLEANILFEQGDADAARVMWIRLTKVLRRVRAWEDLPRVWVNLGVCDTKQNRPADARLWLNKASAAFRKLKNTAELARTRWNMGTYVATFGDQSRALRIYRNAFRTFRGLQMWLDAACVGLDMIEIMIDTNTPDGELTRHACDVADTLAQAGLGLDVAALDQLRKIASENDRHRVVRIVRAALRDARTHCSEVSVDALGKAG